MIEASVAMRVVEQIMTFKSFFALLILFFFAEWPACPGAEAESIILSLPAGRTTIMAVYLDKPTKYSSWYDLWNKVPVKLLVYSTCPKSAVDWMRF